MPWALRMTVQVFLLALPLYVYVGWRLVASISQVSPEYHHAIRMYVDTRRPRVRQRELTVAGLPEALEGLRIVHVSDIQADPRTDDELLERYVDLVNGLDADLILFTGDLVTRGMDHIGKGAEALARMQALYGTFACLGDHDIWSDPEGIQRRLGELGVRMGHNERIDLRIGEASVGLYVMTNAYSDRPSSRGLREGVGGDFAILLSHQPTPDVVDTAARVGYHLMTSGHTHGGQVSIQVFGWSLSASRFETPFVSGFHELGSMLLSVNNGLGLTLAPIRFLAPSEVTLIALQGIE